MAKRRGETYVGCSWYFRFRFKWQRTLERLNDKQAGRLVKAMLYYSMTGQEEALPEDLENLLTTMLNDLDDDAIEAAGTSETNRNSAMKRWHGGAVPERCARMRTDASAYKDGTGNDGNTPYGPPGGGRAVKGSGRRREKTQYTDEDYAGMERNEVDLNGSVQKI